MVPFLDKLSLKRYVLILVLLGCLTLRLGLALYKEGPEIVHDAYIYVQIGQNIADGNGFAAKAYWKTISDKLMPTAHGYVFYPYFLALMFWLFDDNLMAVAVVQALIDTASCLLVFLMARRFTKSPTASLLSASAYAVYPPFILSTCMLMTETTSIFIILGTMYLSLISIERKTVGLSALSGLAMGMTILTRPAMLAFPFVIALIMYLRKHRGEKWITRAAVLVAASYLTVAPWTVRNYIVFHKFVPVTTHFGVVFWGGTGPADGACLGGWNMMVDTRERNLTNHPSIPDVSEQTYQRITAFQAKLSTLDEVERDKVMRQEALKEIKQRPGRYALLMAKKFARLWFNLWHDRAPSAGSIAMAVLNACIYALAFVGYRRKNVDSAYKLTTLYYALYSTLLAVTTIAVMRYSYPIMPFIIILSAVGFLSLFQRGVNEGTETGE